VIRFAWLRALDLSQRPLGYEGLVGRDGRGHAQTDVYNGATLAYPRKHPANGDDSLTLVVVGETPPALPDQFVLDTRAKVALNGSDEHKIP